MEGLALYTHGSHLALTLFIRLLGVDDPCLRQLIYENCILRKKRTRSTLIIRDKHQDGRHDDGIPEVYFPFRSCAEPEKLTAIRRRPVVGDANFYVLT